MHNEEFQNLYSSSNIVTVIKSRKMRWEENVACMREIINISKILVGTLECKRLLGRPRCRSEVIL